MYGFLSWYIKGHAYVYGNRLLSQRHRRRSDTEMSLITLIMSLLLLCTWAPRSRLVKRAHHGPCDLVHNSSRPIINVKSGTCVCPRMTPLCKRSIGLYHRGESRLINYVSVGMPITIINVLRYTGCEERLCRITINKATKRSRSVCSVL